MGFPEGVTLNLLDPCCGCGLALRFLAQGITDNGNGCRTYGIELDNHRAEEALTRIDRVGFGSFYSGNFRFSLGQTVITGGARAVLNDYEVNSALRRHQTGDWGNIPKSDWRINNRAVKNEDRILSSYLSSENVVFWINTEWDRSVTTVMLPDEY